MEPARTVHVVRHGGHTGLVLKHADLSGVASPLARDFRDAEHIEIGWGDRDYYPAAEPTVWMGLRALFWPRPGVLHVVGFRGSPQTYFPGSEVVALGLSQSGLDRLHTRLRESFDLDASGNAIVVGPGLYGDSRFYASRESFHLFKTCNVWTAALLREAGVPINPSLAISAESLMRQLSPHARPIAPGDDERVAPDRVLPGYKGRSSSSAVPTSGAGP